MNEQDDIDVVGGIDLFEPHVVKGWAVRRNDPEKKIIVGVFDDGGNAVAVGQTGVERTDVETVYGFVGAGFEIDLPHQFDKVLQVLVSSHVGRQAAWIPLGTPVSLPRQIYYLEALEKQQVRGWVICHPATQSKLKIGMEVDDVRLAEVGTTLPREDVARTYNVALETGFMLPIPYKISHIGALSTFRLYAHIDGDRSSMVSGRLADLDPSQSISRFRFEPGTRSWKKNDQHF